MYKLNNLLSVKLVLGDEKIALRQDGGTRLENNLMGNRIRASVIG
jgi:hypothetical protein